MSSYCHRNDFMPSIFVCYRREDSAPYAGRLHDRLVPAFGRENVFMDIDTLTPGVDFDEEIRRTLLASTSCWCLSGGNGLTPAR